MITMIGTGHVFRISEQVSFIVKYTWPDAVLIELDERRYNALMCGGGGGKGSENSPKIYRDSAEYQNKMSEKNGAMPGGELLAAINAGKVVDADIICIDKDAEQVMRAIEDEMSPCERTRYSISSVTERLFVKIRSDRDRTIDDEEYIRVMRRRFPTLIEKLIDERNVHMAGKIREAAERYNNLVVVVGDAHVRGICEILNDLDIYKIRLAELMDQESMNNIRSHIWNRKAEGQE